MRARRLFYAFRDFMKLQRQIAGQVYAWLLLLPAAVLMVAFTHFPIVGGFISSFFSTAREGRASKFIGLDNYSSMIAGHGDDVAHDGESYRGP